MTFVNSAATASAITMIFARAKLQVDIGPDVVMNSLKTSRKLLPSVPSNVVLSRQSTKYFDTFGGRS
jgi:hypothetical protein